MIPYSLLAILNFAGDEVKGNPFPELIFGTALLLLGLFMLLAQRKSGRRLAVASLQQNEGRFLRNQIRRRKQVAGMIAIIGVMIACGALIPWEKALATFAVYWLIVLGLAFWTILLAFADLAATQLHSSLELNQMNRQKQELERVAKQIRDAQGSSTQDPPA